MVAVAVGLAYAGAAFTCCKCNCASQGAGQVQLAEADDTGKKYRSVNACLYLRPYCPNVNLHQHSEVVQQQVCLDSRIVLKL